MKDVTPCLSISREEFREIYAGLPILENEELFFTTPSNDVEALEVYLPSKLWRLNNLYTIINKYGDKVRFCMNRAQHKVYAASLRHPRLIILKSRQQGISTLWLVSFFDDCLCNPNFSIGLMAQGLDEAETLLLRTKTLWEELSDMVKQYLNVSLSKDNTKEFSLSNRGTIFIRTSFRSTTLQRLHISEMGKIANKSPEKAKETKTGTLQAIAQGNTAVIESTAEGDNMFKEMWDNAVLYSSARSKKDFMPIFLSWLEDPDCNVEEDQVVSSVHQKYFDKIFKEHGITLTRTQRNFWIVQFRELGEKIYQEYPTTDTEAFMATKEGAYYAALYYEYVRKLNREVKSLYDKNLDVQLSVDLGMDDTMTLMPFQWYTNQMRVIGEFADEGQDIKYYCDWIKRQEWFPNLTHLILPHDAEVNELTSGKTRTQVFEEELKTDRYGNPAQPITITVLERTSSVNDDIEQVRQVVKILWISEACEYIKYCLCNYKREWDEKREMWRDKPNHDQASHGADCFRYAVKGADRRGNVRKKVQVDKASVLHGRSKRNGDMDI